ncbi:MAG: hypothetical protein LBL69_00040 [Zoogloeaceae bacterium]|jgi:hypothetical protein|nr:hypothetical protein [Zoogloeaceae bacterium]
MTMMMIDPPDAMRPVAEWQAWLTRLQTAYPQDEPDVQACITEAKEMIVWRAALDHELATHHAEHQPARLAA